MTSEIKAADGTDFAAVTAAMDALNPDANDRLVAYTIGTKVFFVKFPIA